MNLTDFLINLPEIISSAVESNEWFGYLAILLAMFLENLFPPIPSELIMPLGGFYVFQGNLNFFPVIFAGLIGTLLGALPWYGIGRFMNEKKLEIWLTKYGKWLGINPNELNRSRVWFNKHGRSLIFWGRLVPGIRTLISVPAGIELMPITPFLIWTTAGSLIWVLFLTTAGIILGESYSMVEVWIDPVSKVIKVIICISLIAIIFWIIIRSLFGKNRH